MQTTYRKTGFKVAGSNSLLYALLLLLCALISYFGHSGLAGLIFLPAALAVELQGRYRLDDMMCGQYFRHS